jgi:hypothetical protein
MEIGTIGVRRSKRHGTTGLDQLEALGFGAFWIGGSPSTEEARGHQRLHAAAQDHARVLRRTRQRGSTGAARRAVRRGGRPFALARKRALGAHPYFVQQDIDNGGSRRLIDAVIPHGV